MTIKEFDRAIGMNRKTISANWSYFERIYCISVNDRSDRRQECMRQFKRIGLYDRVEFILVDRHLTNCEQGIYESHLGCIRKGLALGAARLLIFEDDVIFERFCPLRLNTGIDFLKHHPDWRMFFLGCMVKHSRRTQTPAVRKIVYRCLTHAYAINRPFAKVLLDHPWDHLPYDGLLSRFRDNVYSCHPTFAFQSNSVSDNDRHRRLETFRRWCGGLRRIQKVSEWYHAHKPIILALHGIGLMALVWMLF